MPRALIVGKGLLRFMPLSSGINPVSTAAK